MSTARADLPYEAVASQTAAALPRKRPGTILGSAPPQRSLDAAPDRLEISHSGPESSAAERLQQFKHLARRTDETMRALNVADEHVRTCLMLVVDRYDEPHRHYHTLAHLEAMLQALEGQPLQPVDPPALVLAVLFHDVVYDPRRHDNEDLSKERFAQWARDASLPAPLQSAVLFLIDRTKLHNAQNASHPDLALFLDLDLEVLSRPPSAYALYTEQVRREYAHVPMPLFAHLRAQVLRSLLQQPSLYATPTFRQANEAQARRNVQDEIERLERQTRGWIAQAVITVWRVTQACSKLWGAKSA